MEDIKPKYVVLFYENLMVSNRFMFAAHEKAEAIALTKNLSIRYGEKNVAAFHIYYNDDGSEDCTVDCTESFLRKC